MFDVKIYTQRRNRLKKQLKSGIALFLGNDDTPMNYPSNPYPFRQDSSFLYFFGLDSYGLAGIVDIDEKKDILFGDDITMEDIIWMGSQPLLKKRAAEVGVTETAPFGQLEATLKRAIQQGRKVHFLPPYRPETKQKISQFLGIRIDLIKDYVSKDLINAAVEQRSVKIKEEIAEMEFAHEVTYDMYLTGMKMGKAGIFEREIVGQMEGTALSSGCHMAFPVILSINGQILHNHYHGNKLKKGRLVVADSGAESPMHYAADITRTFPVNGKFTEKQKEIYNIVLEVQETAIKAIKPGVKYRNIHLKAAKTIFLRLKELGLMKGDVEEGVKAGAHALFFPHGLGHHIGLDVHDMEDYGEDYVGYDPKTMRSDQFGLAYLRLAKELQPGYVITVEPGIYFIPDLIDKWIAEKKHMSYINYKKVNEYRDFGGVRIEDNIVVTDKARHVLGKGIPKTINDVEQII
ncbi:MAG: aminopeptidase P family protein [Candidatus Aminicenantes bacterium]|nr:aminopeptidase P family protein [Candidatus Aminicenantes bacterium]